MLTSRTYRRHYICSMVTDQGFVYLTSICSASTGNLVETRMIVKVLTSYIQIFKLIQLIALQ